MLSRHRSPALALLSLVLVALGGLAVSLSAGPAEKAAPRLLDQQIDRGLLAALKQGVQLYQAGDADGCYRLFEGALLTVQPLLDDRPAVQRAIEKGLGEARATAKAVDRAFVLRGVLDRTRNALRPAPVAKTVPAKKTPGPALSDIEQAVLDLTNAERQKAGLAVLRASAVLSRAAREHSANMARQGQLNHTLDGKGPGERLRDVGYRSLGWGENCALGQRTAAQALASWMSSDGHRRNILGANFTEIGLGVAADGQGRLYFTQVFARPAPSR